MKKIILIILVCSNLTFLLAFGLGDITSGLTGGSKKKSGGNSMLGGIMKVAKTAQESNENSQFTLYDEYMVGRDITAKILGTYKISTNKKLNDYITAVGSTIVLSSRIPNHYDGIKFILLDTDKEINAFATPGGFVMITTGMLKFLKNEDELATIIGHEVSHLELEHGTAAIKEANNMKVASAFKDVAVDAAVGDKGKLVSGLTGKLFGKLFESITVGYSVEIESQADSRGMELAYIAGYDPSVFPKILHRYKEKKHSYGGANYPREREKDALSKLSQIGNVQSSKKLFSLRTARYKKEVLSQ